LGIRLPFPQGFSPKKIAVTISGGAGGLKNREPLKGNYKRALPKGGPPSAGWPKHPGNFKLCDFSAITGVFPETNRRDFSAAIQSCHDQALGAFPFESRLPGFDRRQRRSLFGYIITKNIAVLEGEGLTIIHTRL
jgi:hypothetical protein